MTTDPAGPTAVLLIAHGSRRAEANDDARALAGRIAATGEYPIVRAAFLELAGPDIPAGAEQCIAAGAARVLMVPYFLAEGVHLRRDLTAARDELAGRYPAVEFRLGAPLGPHPLLDRLVCERIRETALTPPPSRRS
jgi:sirohydrochlorin ferrochelatase